MNRYTILKRYILSHKDDFDFTINNGDRASDYLTLSEIEARGVAHHVDSDGKWTDSEMIKCKIVPGVNNWQLGEIPAWKWIYSQMSDDDWVVLSHYRRRLECTQRGSLGIAAPMTLQASVLQQTAYCHSVTMAKILEAVLEEKYVKILKSNKFVPYNLFCVDKHSLKEWIDFQDYYIGEMVRKYTGPDIELFCRKDTDTFTPRPGKNISVDYQRRFYAFVSERLSTAMWLDNMYRGVQFVPTNVILMEDGQTI